MIMMMISENAWFKELLKRYGKNPESWKFICPQCQVIQTLSAAREMSITNPLSLEFFGLSCIYCDHSHFRDDNPIYVSLPGNLYRNQMDFHDRPLVPRITA